MTGPRTESTRRPVRVLLALAFLVWASRTVLPGDLLYSSLDRSWCLGLARALVSRWRFGVDVVFTFGPLGCLSTGAYLPEVFWIKVLAWEGAFQFLAAVVLAAAGLGIGNRWLRVAWFAALLLQPLDPDAHAFLTIAAAFAWIARRRDRPAPAISPILPTLIGAPVLAGLALVKFTATVAVASCVLASCAVLWRSGARRSAGAFLAAFLGAASVLWTACGQSVLDLPLHLARSAEMSSAYSEAMSRPGPPWIQAVALALLGFALFALWVHGRRSPLALLFHLSLLLVAYKAGFVRALDHTTTFFVYAATAACLFDAAAGSGPAPARIAVIARGACLACGVVGLWIARDPRVAEHAADPFRRVASHARALFGPRAFQDELEAREAADRRRADLPRTREIVGKEPIDMVPDQQVLLFHNDLAWRPRPVFQSYACLTPGLQELNARFLEGERAPRFLLFSLDAIDWRLPAMDEAQGLQVIARDYEPVLQEKGFLLLRRSPRSGPRDAPGIPSAFEIGFGEWVEVRTKSTECRLLALDIRPTLAGRLRTILDSAPPLWLDLELEGGESLTARIVPAMMREGIIFDPLFRTQADWIAWCAGKSPRRPVRMRARAPDPPWMYERRIGVKILPAGDVAPDPRPGLERTLLYSIFPTSPAAVSSSRPPSRELLRGEEVLALSPASTLTFDIAPGRRKLSGRFGTKPVGRPGAVLRAVLVRAGAEERVLLELRQGESPQEPRLVPFSADFDAEAGARLELRAVPGPQSGPQAGPERDAACFSMVRIE